MDYIKKLCILKQVSSGFAADGRQVSALLTAETWGGRLTLTLSPIGFAPLSAGRYRCLVCDARGQTEVFDLPVPAANAVVRKAGVLDISAGFFAAVCFVSGKVTIVACGSCGPKQYDAKALCAALDESAPPQAAPTSVREPPSAAGAPHGSPAAPRERGDAPPYDDEVVASENYYEFADADLEALRIRAQGEGSEQAAAESAGGSDAPQPPPENAAPPDTCAAEGPPDPSAARAPQAAPPAPDKDAAPCAGEAARTEQPRYYAKVQGDLTALFDKYPAEEELAECIPYSRWAKISFARGKHYTVGVIFDETLPRYICYGVPAAARTDPPAALRGFCSFLPLSVFDLNGKGYWMMFQDAETGECIKI